MADDAATLIGQVIGILETTKVLMEEKKAANTSQVCFKLPSAVQKSPVLSFPPEIRNMIWKLCLSHPKGLQYKMKQNHYGCLTMAIYQPPDEPRPKIREICESSISKRMKQFIKDNSFRNLAIMQTCQTAYNEAAPVLWSQRFTFHSIIHLQAFLFSDARLDLVRDIYVERIDRSVGVNYLPAICTILADKVKGLERFDVDMSCMHQKRCPQQRVSFFRDNDGIRKAGVQLGFDVYFCMHPWVTKVVHDQGIERLMKILKIARETKVKSLLRGGRIHSAFEGGGHLSANQRKIADAATAGEILRLVNLYEKKA